MMMRDRSMLIEGYAALFGVVDLGGDRIRAGAFARSLERTPVLPMLLQHRSGAVIGRWSGVVEDGRGLFVRGLVERDTATALIGGGLDGLSIGFRPRLWRPRGAAGRDLLDVDLVEISLVANPMQPRARLTPLTGSQAIAA